MIARYKNGPKGMFRVSFRGVYGGEDIYNVFDTDGSMFDIVGRRHLIFCRSGVEVRIGRNKRCCTMKEALSLVTETNEDWTITTPTEKIRRPKYATA